MYYFVFTFNLLLCCWNTVKTVQKDCLHWQYSKPNTIDYFIKTDNEENVTHKYEQLAHKTDGGIRCFERINMSRSASGIRHIASKYNPKIVMQKYTSNVYTAIWVNDDFNLDLQYPFCYLGPTFSCQRTNQPHSNIDPKGICCLGKNVKKCFGVDKILV